MTTADECPEGVRTPTPTECPLLIDPVCGCDAMTSDNEFGSLWA
jgi:hypothetical protein